VSREARLLAAVARVSPLPVPQPRFTAPAQGCLAYAKLPGSPLLDMSASQRPAHATALAVTLAELLTVMHAGQAGPLTGLAEIDDQPPLQWRDEAAEIYAQVGGSVPRRRRRSVEAFLAAPPPAGGYALAFSHNDLGMEHVLVDPGTWTITGVIDWSDAAIVDPAYDFGLLYRDLGPAALDAALGAYRTDAESPAALAQRAVFYARCSVLEDLAYGIEAGQDKYLDNALAAMEWLFPA
jgi:aminoglycoside phosphotransferase (APT) family kinase protein